MDEILSAEMRDDDDFYKLMGCDELSSIEQVNTEFKIKARTAHPDKNPDDSEAAQRFAKLQRARDILTDDKRRQEYDFWRRSGIAVSYDTWMSMKGAVHTSMHWAVRKKKDLMLEEDPKNIPESPEVGKTIVPPHSDYAGHSRLFVPAGWTRKPANDILQSFRNYNI